MQRVISAGVCGHRLPRGAAGLGDPLRHPARARGTPASPASTTDRSAGASAAARSRLAQVAGSPQARTHSWSSHSPMMLRR